MTLSPAPLETIADRGRATRLLDPLRIRILDLARSPASAADIARRLDLPRQKVNYHVHELADAGFLRDLGERRKGNLMERRYVATARGYLLDPGLLGPLAADPRSFRDAFSAARLLALLARSQSQLARAARDAGRRWQRLATLSIAADLRFESAEQRREFAGRLREAVTDVIARHSSPDRTPEGRPAPGRPYRLVLGVHPVPAAPESDEEAGDEWGEGGDRSDETTEHTTQETDR